MNRLKYCSLVVSGLACAIAAHAQTSQTTGAIRGVVRAKQAGAIAGASVLVRQTETGLTRRATTDANGAYVMSLLPVGPYEITVTSPGMRTGKGNVRVTMTETAMGNFNLDKAEANAVVEIMAQPSTVDTATVTTASTMSEETLKEVPLNGRNFTDAIQLTPGAPAKAEGYRTSIDGARGIGNNILIDGASYNSRFNGEQRGGTRIPFSFGLDSIRELQVISNPYDVQYGDATGGVVNAITKGGTNEVQGMVLSQIRPGSLVANMRPVPVDPNGTTNTPGGLKREFNRSEYAFNLGGPIIKDKLHYFVNVNTVRTSTESVPTVGFQSTDGTNTGFNTFWGTGGMGTVVSAHNGGLTLKDETTKRWTDLQKHTVAMVRLDWNASEAHQATLRVNMQDYDGQNDIWAGSFRSDRAESNNSQVKIRSISWVGELHSKLGDNMLNEARIQFSTERRPETPNSNVSVELGLPRFYAGNNYLDPRNTDETTTQLINNLSWFKDNWTIKAGIDWQMLTYRNTFFQYGRGSFYFKTWDVANQWYQGVAPNSTLTYTQSWSNTDGYAKFSEKILANYVSAEYAGLLDQRLTLTLGLRYTREMYDDNPNPNPRMAGLDHMADNGSWDPRLGFALDVFGDHRTVLRGGFGLFSVTNPAQNVASSFLQNGQNTLPFKVSYSSAYAYLFTNGGMLSAAERINGNHNVTALTPSQVLTLPQGTVLVTLMDPEARMAQARVTSLRLEHDFGNGYTVKAGVMYKRFMHLQYFVDINMNQKNPATGAWDSSIFYNDGYPFVGHNYFDNATTSVATRPGRAIVRGRSLDLAGCGSVGLSRFDGEGSYRSLTLEASKRADGGFGFNANVTFAASRDTNSNERNTAQAAASNPIDPSSPLGIARADNDIPFRANLMLMMPRFLRIRSSFTFTYQSGYPLTPRDYNDVNGDGYLNDAVWGGRNSFRGPANKWLNFQMSRDWKLGRRLQFEGTVQVFNVFNWANWGVGSTTVNSDGTPTALFGALTNPDARTREVQFTAKLRF